MNYLYWNKFIYSYSLIIYRHVQQQLYILLILLSSVNPTTLVHKLYSCFWSHSQKPCIETLKVLHKYYDIVVSVFNTHRLASLFRSEMYCMPPSEMKLFHCCICFSVFVQRDCANTCYCFATTQCRCASRFCSVLSASVEPNVQKTQKLPIFHHPPTTS